MTLKQLTNAALPSVVGVATLALAIRYFGDKPIIEDVKEGLKGNVKA